MTEELIDHYQALLADHVGLANAMCVSYARGVDEDTMVAAFGGDPADTAPRTLAELDAELDRYRYDEVPAALLVTRVGDWLVGLEPNGFQGSRPEVLRAAAAGGAALSVFWNVNGTNELRYAVDGRTAVSFDMEVPDERHGPDPGALDEHAAGLPFGYGGDTYAAGLALAERVTGVRLTAELLDRTFRRALLRPVPEDLVNESLVGDPALDDPFVREVLAAPTADKLPAITRYLAEAVARDAGIDGEPEVRAALAALAAGGPPDEAVRRRVRELAERYQLAVREGREDLQRVHAAKGVAGALDPDPARASFEVHFSAGYSLRGRDERIRNIVLGRCRDRAAGND